MTFFENLITILYPIISAEEDFYLNLTDKVVLFRSAPDTYYNIVKLDNIEIENITKDYVKEHYPNVQLTNIKNYHIDMLHLKKLKKLIQSNKLL